jgi:hypothetical protein
MTGLEIVTKQVDEGEKILENARRRMARCLMNSVQVRGGHQRELVVSIR